MWFLKHTFLLLASLALSSAQPCDLCGCDACPPGPTPLGNPTGVLQVADFLDLLPPALVALIPAGTTQVDCNTINGVDLAGIIPPESCVLRENPNFREACGCLPIPTAETPAPTMTPTTLAPTLSPTASPVASTPAPTTLSPTDPPTEPPTASPTDAITMSPVMSPVTGMPTMAAPVAVPTTDAPSMMPVVIATPTETVEAPVAVPVEAPVDMPKMTSSPVAGEPTPMSSLVCADGKCTFTRVDTDDYALDAHFSPSPTDSPCDFCGNPGERFTYTPIGNPDAVLPIAEVADSLPAELKQLIPPDLVEIPCGLLEGAGLDVPPSSCSLIQQNNVFRETCGCPPLLILNATVDTTMFPTFGPLTDTSLAPWTDPVNQDQITPSVALTRDFRRGLFNAVSETSARYGAPLGTRLAILPGGETFEESRCSLKFCSQSNGDCSRLSQTKDLIGKPLILHIEEEDLYYNLMITAWTAGQDKTTGVSNPLGGGFQYIRDEVPIDGSTLTECPVCTLAKATPSVLKGAIDNEFVEVAIEGVTPANANVTIVAVGQSDFQACNLPREETDRRRNLKADEGRRLKARGGSAKHVDHQGRSRGMRQVLPNAGDLGGSSVMLRRFKVQGDLSPYRYSIYYTAAVDGTGSCHGEVEVCVPGPGLEWTCDDYISNFNDATSTSYCDYGFY